MLLTERADLQWRRFICLCLYPSPIGDAGCDRCAANGPSVGTSAAGLLVAAPGTGNRHVGLFCHLRPGQTSVTQLHDLLRGRQDEPENRRDASVHRHDQAARSRWPRDAQLRTDLAQGPTLGVQVGCTLNHPPRYRNEPQSDRLSPRHLRCQVAGAGLLSVGIAS
jgi:hypothetical protein